MTDVAILLMDLRGGGAERVMLNLARGFADRGWAVDLVLVQAVGEYMTQIPTNVRVKALNCSRLIRSLPALIQYLNQHQPRALLSALEDTNLIAISANRLAASSTRVVVTVHNHLSHEARSTKQLKRRIVPHLLRWFYPSADVVVGVSHGVVMDLLKYAPTAKTQVIYNPIVTPDLITQFQTQPDHPWFLPNQPPVILGVGRLSPQKDFATLIRAFAIVRQQFPARLLILGEGPERANLTTLIQSIDLTSEIELPGFVNNPCAYMSSAALLVMSSAWEGFGNVLVEAMAAGTPVVSTDCESGPAEILADGKYGMLVKVGDISGLATAIVQTLSLPVDAQQLQQRAAEFSLEKALDRYHKVLELS